MACTAGMPAGTLSQIKAAPISGTMIFALAITATNAYWYINIF